jgi:hypothetical protein
VDHRLPSASTSLARHHDQLGHAIFQDSDLAGTMAEHIYSKGTRVWFVDKDQAWISGEVTQVTKGAGDAVTLTFIDERGRVCASNTGSRNTPSEMASYRM